MRILPMRDLPWRFRVLPAGFAFACACRVGSGRAEPGPVYDRTRYVSFHAFDRPGGGALHLGHVV